MVSHPILRLQGLTLGAAAALALSAMFSGCGSDQIPPNYGSPPDANLFNPGDGGGGTGYGGSGGQSNHPDAGRDSAPPPCPTSLRQCAEQFTYPFNGTDTSVSLMGAFTAGGWTTGVPMTLTGGEWQVTVPVPYGQPVQYKFRVNGTTWVLDPKNPDTVDAGSDNSNSEKAAITCTKFTCATPPVPPPGVFDWRDAVIYFVFVDRFFDGDPSNNCSVTGASTGKYTSANYLGGDWAGVTQKIDDGYFKALGVNTLWITVPVKNADKVLGAGVNCSGGSCSADGYEFTGYHGYWPSDPTTVEPCFGTAADLTTLVTTAHAKNLKILFDYAMVDVHTSSSVYTSNPSWFTPFCQCGDTSHGCGDYNDYKCWFAPYLAHFDFTNSMGARNYSVGAALGLVQKYGNDAFRLDAIKQVDPSWLASLRPQITTLESTVAGSAPPQHFYMVGETYDFADMGYIRSFIDPTNQLDGQFDFPLRYRLVDAMLLRDTGPGLDYPIPGGSPWTFSQPPGMKGLAGFMDFNDGFYPPDAVMSTFIGNHDLPRSIHYAEQTLPSWLGGNDQAALTTNGQGNAWTGEPTTETDPNAYERLANAFAVILTNKGAPLIYYGDEVGLPGAGDPDNRRMMQWSGLSKPQQGLHDRIATLTAIRAKHPSMRRGARTTLYVDADLWVFSETTTDTKGMVDTVYVGINRNDSDRTTTSVPSGMPELVAGGTSSGSDTIPARQTRIYSSYVPGPGDAGTD